MAYMDLSYSSLFEYFMCETCNDVKTKIEKNVNCNCFHFVVLVSKSTPKNSTSHLIANVSLQSIKFITNLWIIEFDLHNVLRSLNLIGKF